MAISINQKIREFKTKISTTGNIIPTFEIEQRFEVLHEIHAEF
jgi:hypothetical protein